MWVFSTSAILCFEEMYMVLQRFKTLIKDCSSKTSKIRLQIQSQSMADNFYELILDLSNLLEIFSDEKDRFGLSEDEEELICLVRKQSSETKAFVNPKDESLRRKSVREPARPAMKRAWAQSNPISVAELGWTYISRLGLLGPFLSSSKPRPTHFATFIHHWSFLKGPHNGCVKPCRALF
ncbi:hypothetical protein PanWU01x14_268980 [Parasponia andersonii]|uniref:Uncharacterized protein n=1 Tax=Parasponia andersonii TaxID=3476 RepID=A0A2P5B5T6_PARAD|nr:hypothetical protein PanWU01x14_268980 [Parasponia andersonii]